MYNTSSGLMRMVRISRIRVAVPADVSKTRSKV